VTPQAHATHVPTPYGVARRHALCALLTLSLLGVGTLGSVPAAHAAEGFELLVSSTSNRTSPAPLASATVTGTAYVFLSPEAGATQVRFWLDDPTRSSSARQIEKNAPWDFAGGSSTTGLANAWDTTKVADGEHVITAQVSLSAGGTAVVHATFTVDNVIDDTTASQVHLGWVDDPATSLAVVWRTGSTPSPSTVEYRVGGTTTWTTVAGAVRPSGTAGELHEATLTDLEPGTDYEYRVAGEGGTTSDVFTTRTAPAPGAADFDAVYFADTGIAGRLDGLTTGTQQVIDEIAALDPLFVLPGGDYAYFNTDNRFPDLDAAIDAWFRQMEPVARRSPMMPVYGNHEALLGEDVDSWIARFPTPDGFDGRRNYSFDVGDVHFVAIFAVTESSPLPTATVTWIRDDILAARAAGARWIVPYFHVSPFSDGANHPSNLALRGQLGPLFEELDVPVALSSHDQSYERTYPLTDVPSSNTPTSTALDCYTPDDGTTWVKTSPGGKLSNKNRGFSQFTTEPAPAYVAVRANAMHHFTRLRVAAAGTLRVETFGVTGDGAPPVLVDAFEYTTGSCGPALTAEPRTVALEAERDGEPVEAEVTIATNDGTTAAYGVTDDASWLSVTPTASDTPSTLALIADPSGLAAGTHTATVTATADGYRSTRIEVSVSVASGDGFELLVSQQPNRAAPTTLDGATVQGSIYAFVLPEAGASRVRFWLDNPATTGTPRQTENNAPWDFAGGNTKDGTAKPFNTSTVAEGPHTITARLDRSDGGTEVLHATFVVDNISDIAALVATPVSVSFTTVEGASPPNSTVSLSATTGETAAFTITDDAPWLSATPSEGTTPATFTLVVEAAGLAPGTYQAVVTATASGLTDATVPVTLSVDPEGSPPPPPPSDATLVFSTSSSRSNPVTLHGATVSRSIYVFISPDTDVTKVVFWLDDPTMAGTPYRSENGSPFDFAGGPNDGNARPWKTTSVSNGSHTITAALTLAGGGTRVIHATFVVAN